MDMGKAFLMTSQLKGGPPSAVVSLHLKGLRPRPTRHLDNTLRAPFHLFQLVRREPPPPVGRDVIGR